MSGKEQTPQVVTLAVAFHRNTASISSRVKEDRCELFQCIPGRNEAFVFSLRKPLGLSKEERCVEEWPKGLAASKKTKKLSRVHGKGAIGQRSDLGTALDYIEPDAPEI